jgi:hypothetical protein
MFNLEPGQKLLKGATYLGESGKAYRIALADGTEKVIFYCGLVEHGYLKLPAPKPAACRHQRPWTFDTSGFYAWCAKCGSLASGHGSNRRWRKPGGGR